MHILDVLRSRASWQRGRIFMQKRELQSLLANRFGDPRPRAREIQLAIRRLTRSRLLSWAVLTKDGVCYVM
jgi:hypothetical protein